MLPAGVGFEILSATFFCGVLTILLFYWYTSTNHDFWKKKNIPYVKPWPIFGSSLDILYSPLPDVLTKRYREVGKVHGYFEKYTPILSVGDPVLLKEIMVKNFHNFPNRTPGHPGSKVCSKMLTNLRGEDWKRVRSIVSPAFSTGNIKRVLHILKSCSSTLIRNFIKLSSEKEYVDIKCLYGAFAMDVIASAAFSTKIDSHGDPENPFAKSAHQVFSRNVSPATFIISMLPPIRKLVQLFSPKSDTIGPNFFSEKTLEIIEERKKTGQRRNDFLQLLLDIASQEIPEEKPEENDKCDIATNYTDSDAGHQIFKNSLSKNLTMEELVSQCVVFFLAGYQTTSLTLTFATYLLALHQDLQQKLAEEVDSVLERTQGELTYEAVQGMKYLDNVVSETLRLYPPAPRVERVSEDECQLGDGTQTVPKGTIVSIPIFPIHRDPKIYPDPEKFDPDRFNPDERAKRGPCTYIPFGAGPRSCIGMRFALLEIKTCLAYVIANFRIRRSSLTKVPLEFNTGVQNMMHPKEIYVELELRKDAISVK